jgi:hypothetical protein
MNYLDKWKVIEPLNKGGQGQVYRVWRKADRSRVQNGITEAIKQITSAIHYGKQSVEENYDELRQWLPKMLQMEDPANQFALKVLHEPNVARDHKTRD